LVYEGEQEGAVSVAESLLGEALKKVYEASFPAFRNLKRTDEHNPFLALQNWFSAGGSIELLDEFSQSEYEGALDVAPLNEFVEKQSTSNGVPQVFLKEMVLWALSEYNQINRVRTAVSTDFNDVFGNLLGND
jgi:magnesium chelatase subunit I